MKRNMNKNILGYQAKIIGAFSFREVIGIVMFVVGAWLMFLLYRLLFPFLTDYGLLAGCFLGLGALPGICFGFIRPYGLNFETYISVVFIEMYITPQILILQNDWEKEKDEISAKGPFSTPECKAYS